MYEKIVFVKTGWSPTYKGEDVSGRHGYISQYGEAHGRFNFKRARNGKFYGYVPPIGRSFRPPQPPEGKGWLVIFVAAEEGKGKLKIVGWYEDATFERGYEPRPKCATDFEFDQDVNGEDFVYCVTARHAHLIPIAE